MLDFQNLLENYILHRILPNGDLIITSAIDFTSNLYLFSNYIFIRVNEI